jgi:hypothetical protein
VGAPGATGQDASRCAECATLLAEGQDRVVTADRVFCRPCYGDLTAQLQQAIEAQDRDVSWPRALAGALGGAVVGVLAWWGFTVATRISFGLVAVVIGFAVAKGAVLLSGNKRARGLQILAVIVSTVAYFYASYLVNRTFVLRTLAEQGQQGMGLPLLPDPELFIQVVRLGLGIMDLVFLAIVIWEAWRIPAPVRLAPR